MVQREARGGQRGVRMGSVASGAMVDDTANLRIQRGSS